MSETLGNFLVDLGSNADLLGRFMENADAELARTPLTADERAAMLARDSRRVGRVLGASPAKGIEGNQHGKKKKKGSKKKKKTPRKPAKKR
jgi:hypothetical protein